MSQVSGRPTGDARRSRSASAALVALSLCVLLSSFGTSSANVALPMLAQAFGAPLAAVQWVILAYLVAVTAFVVGVGRMGDVVGRRRLLLAGLALFAAASLACGLAPSLGGLIAARSLQGIAAAVLIAIGMALAGNTSPRGRVGTAMGAIGTMSALGTALGPSLGGFLVSGLGWRALFIAPVPLAVMAFVLVRGNVPEDGGRAPAGAPGADIAGTAFLALAVGTYALAMSGVTGIAGIGNGLLLVGAVTFVVIFLMVEARRAAPLLALLTAGYALFQAANNTATMSATAKDRRGVVSGVLNLSRNLGLVTGASLMGAIYSSTSGAGGRSGAVAGTGLAFGVAAALLAVGLAGRVLWERRAQRRKTAGGAAGLHGC